MLVGQPIKLRLENDDEILVDRAQKGDLAAFGMLYHRHFDFVRKSAIKLLWGLNPAEYAQDVAQDVFIVAWRRLPGFLRRAEFRTWLYGITLNVVRTVNRKHTTGPDICSLPDTVEKLEKLIEKTGVAHFVNPMREFEEAEEAEAELRLIKAVQKAIDSLSEKQKEVVILYTIIMSRVIKKLHGF